MPKHTELSHVAIRGGRHRLCLDRVDKGETDSLYCFVWRGTKKSKNGFGYKPAYFSFDMLGKLLNKAIREDKISLKIQRTGKT